IHIPLARESVPINVAMNSRPPTRRPPPRPSQVWSESLQSMEHVIQVFDQLQGPTDDRLKDLVTPYRRFVRVDDVGIKEAPFSTSKKTLSRFFLFKDLILIGKHINVSKVLKGTADEDVPKPLSKKSSSVFRLKSSRLSK